jgi:hypothetical protein
MEITSPLLPTDAEELLLKASIAEVTKVPESDVKDLSITVVARRLLQDEQASGQVELATDQEVRRLSSVTWELDATVVVPLSLTNSSTSLGLEAAIGTELTR